jgi:N6-adenosine-specific RNA methylase IME4
MTSLAQYHAARAALADATRVDEVMSIHDEMEHVRLYAKQIKDRTLLADASEFQMRVERRLGVLISAAKAAGQIVEGRPRKGENPSDPEGFPRVTLAEAGIDYKLSSQAQRTASISELAFEAMIQGMREKMASGRAIVVDPVNQAGKDARDAQRRNDHAARTLDGGSVDDLRTLAASGYKAKALYLDPPWHFKARSDAGEGRSANLHYTTGAIERIMEDLAPVRDCVADDCVMFMWMVDWCPQAALDLIKALDFTHKTTAFTWAKQLSSGDGWAMTQGYWTRANPEACWLATRGQPKRLHADVRQLIVAPIMEHSRKPDDAYERIERLVEGPYLELYARRPRPGWTSWGNELKFEMPPHDPDTGEVIEDGDEPLEIPEFLTPRDAASEVV